MAEITGYQQHIREVLAGLSALPDPAAGIDAQLATVTAASIRLIRGAACADVMLFDGDRHRSVAATSGFIKELGTVQIQRGQGPGIEAAFDGTVIRVTDLAADRRWPEFTAAALRHGVRSVLTFPLCRCRNRGGALNIYGSAAGAFNIDDEALGALLAAHAAILLSLRRNRLDTGEPAECGDAVDPASGCAVGARRHPRAPGENFRPYRPEIVA